MKKSRDEMHRNVSFDQVDENPVGGVGMTLEELARIWFPRSRLQHAVLVKQIKRRDAR